MVDILEILITSILSVVAGVAVFLVQRAVTQRRVGDRKIFRWYQAVFNRPAFRGPVVWTSDWQNYLLAVDDVIASINQGTTPQRQGPGGEQVPPATYIKNDEWRSTMFEIVDRMTSIKKLVDEAERIRLEQGLTYPYELPDSARQELGRRMDFERDKIIEELNDIWKALKLPPLTLPTKVLS